MRKIIAIGGGELSEGETAKIDKYIVASAHKKNPKLLFIPTASSDDETYIASVKKLYEHLGCHVNSLRLLHTHLSKENLRLKILNADIIYVGGGNTKQMISIWKKLDVDQYLREAYEHGIIMSGLSAGSMCWFEKGHSDSDTTVCDEKNPYSMVDTLGWFPLFVCPHHNEDTRAEDFDQKILKNNRIGLALENQCAIEICDDKFRIHQSTDHVNAYKIHTKNGIVRREKLDCSTEYKPLETLIES